MNKVFLSGNLTRDPEIRYTQSGRAMARMGIAVRRAFRSKNAENSDQPDADFFNLTAWEKTAEFCSRYLTKGSRVFVEGRIQTYSYEGQDGVKRSGVDIQVENIEFGDSKRAAGDSGSAPAKAPQKPARKDYDDFGRDDGDDIDVPF